MGTTSFTNIEIKEGFFHLIFRKYSKHSVSRVGGKLKQKGWPRIM